MKSLKIKFENDEVFKEQLIHVTYDFFQEFINFERWAMDFWNTLVWNFVTIFETLPDQVELFSNYKIWNNRKFDMSLHFQYKMRKKSDSDFNYVFLKTTIPPTIISPRLGVLLSSHSHNHSKQSLKNSTSFWIREFWKHPRSRCSERK